MPHVAITMIPGRDDPAKLALAKSVQRFLCDQLSLEERFVSVSVEEVPMSQWGQFMEGIPAETLLVKPGT